MKDMIDKKTIIFVIITIVFISIVITIGYLSSSKSNYIVIDDYLIEYKNKEFKKANINDVKGYRFRMLQNQNYIGNYYFDHREDDIDRLFFKNDDGVNAINIPLLGLDDNTDYIEYEVEDMTEDDFNLYKGMVDKTVNYKLKDLSIAKKYVVDNKGNKFNIFAVKYEGNNPQDDHSMIYVSANNNVVVLDEDYPQEDVGGYLFYAFNVEYVIDLNKDNKYELIVSKSHYDVTDYSIYELDSTFTELFYTGE